MISPYFTILQEFLHWERSCKSSFFCLLFHFPSADCIHVSWVLYNNFIRKRQHFDMFSVRMKFFLCTGFECVCIQSTTFPKQISLKKEASRKWASHALQKCSGTICYLVFTRLTSKVDNNWPSLLEVSLPPCYNLQAQSWYL